MDGWMNKMQDGLNDFGFEQRYLLEEELDKAHKGNSGEVNFQRRTPVTCWKILIDMTTISWCLKRREMVGSVLEIYIHICT